MSQSSGRRVGGRAGILVALALGTAACNGPGGTSTANTTPNSTTAAFNPPWLADNVAAGTPVMGGTLILLGNNDVDHLDTASMYYTASYLVERAFARQLYSYAASTNIDKANVVTPDIATALPTISSDGLTYTVHLQSGVMWNSTPPRPVTAQDFILGIKRLCNPVQPAAATGYYNDTIAGFKDYCTAFLALTTTDAPALKAFMDSHDISGVQAPDASTLVFTLKQPAGDFLNLLAMPFISAAPVEYENYVPDSAELHNHLLSDGPYAVVKYTPNQEVDLDRNPAWDQSTDHLRHQYVDHIMVKEGATEAGVQQQIEAGTADMEFDTTVPTSDLARLQGPPWDKRLGVFPSPDTNPYVVFNLQSTNANGALQNVKVRQALEYAIDKVAMGKIYGGAALNDPLNQVVPPGQTGYVKYDPYPTPGNRGDPAKCKQLLAAAGVTNLTLKDGYRNGGKAPAIFQEVQHDFATCGVTVVGVPVPSGDYYGKFLVTPSIAKAGQWDISEPGWIPDWSGNNGRTMVSPLFDGRTYGNGSTNYGDFNDSGVNALIDKALVSKNLDEANANWHAVDQAIMALAPFIPMQTQFTPVFRSARVHNAIWMPFATNYDPTQIWLSS